MKKKNLLIVTLIIISLLAGCTNTPNTNTTPDTNNGTDNVTENGDNAPKPVVSKEVPDSYPEDLVPLYEVAQVEGVITVGEDYHQAYYYSNMDRLELLEKYKEFFSNQDVQMFENEYSYELSGNVDGHKVRMYIMPFNEEDPNAVTTSSDIKEEATETPSTTITEEKKYETTVIIFIYADDNVKTQ